MFRSREAIYSWNALWKPCDEQSEVQDRREGQNICDRQEGKGRAIFNLADDGPGVPEEALGRLLEAFYRTDKARSRTENGSGLGLAIVNRAASLMHGEIKVENRKPHGLSFTISYPLEGDHDKENTDR